MSEAISQTLGKAGVRARGAHSSSIAYEKNDIVSYNGSSYIAIVAVPTGISIIDSSYWLQIAAKGDTGAIPNFTIGTVETGAPGTQASITITGTQENPVINMVIPRGDTGNAISSIAKTSTEGKVDTYTITFTDGNTMTYTVTNGAVTSVDQLTGDVSAVSIISITDTATTLGDINTILNNPTDGINTVGRHVLFDVGALGAQMYLCTIFLDTDSNEYKILDMVKGRVSEGVYDPTTLLTMAIARANYIATHSQIDYLQKEIDRLGGKSAIEDYDALGDLIADGSSTSIIDPGDIIPINWISTVHGTTTSGLTVTCTDEDTFINAIGEAEAKTYLFVYDGSSWTYEDVAINLADYGLSVSGTPSTGEVMAIVTTVSTEDYVFTSYDKMEPVNANVPHNWVLEAAYAPNTKVMDTYESLFCIKEGKTLAAGKYYLPLYSYRSGATFNACLEFTSAISGKVQMARSNSGSADRVAADGSTKTGVYAVTSVTPVTFGTATSVGSAIAVTYLSDTDVQSGGYTLLSANDVTYGNLDCTALGCNTWPYSNLHQWLNDDTKGDTFVPAHDNDIASSYNRSKGFLYGIDPRVKDLIQPVKAKWTAGYGNVEDFTRNTTYESEDKVFLLSMKEMSFNINIEEGDISDLYGSYTNNVLTNEAVAERAKYNRAGGTLNSYRWARSTYSSGANVSRLVSSTGSNYHNGAFSAYFYAPAFAIGKPINQ